MIGRLMILQLAGAAGAAALIAWEARRIPAARMALVRVLLFGWSVLAIFWLTVAVLQHWFHPFHLDLMEGAVLQHVLRVTQGQPIYPAPSPDYAPLSYNPLYYLLSAPVVWLAGPSLPAVRTVAVIGLFVSLAVILLAVRQRTGSWWWGVIAAGLFAAAYRAMDAYLDTAHADSWLLASALLGTWMLERAESRAGKVAGMLVLIAGFWFKQHGALFALGGGAWLIWKEGPRRAAPYLLLAAVTGPLLYWLAEPWPFGAAFHYFTLTVPSRWGTLTLAGAGRVLRYGLGNYPVLLPATLAAIVSRPWRRALGPDPWLVQGVAALAVAAMGSMDKGSADNVFVPLGALVIVVGCIYLARWTDQARPSAGRLAVALSFAALLYDPRSVLVSGRAAQAYADLTALIESLPGTVYAPYIAYLPGVPAVYPRIHWVVVDDMVRGHNVPPEDWRRAAALLQPARQPAGEAWVLTNYPLDRAARVVRDLSRCYTLAEDLGDRFAALTGTPRRYDHAWPRYLYRFDPALADRCSAS